MPGNRYLKLGSKSDHRAEISGNIVWYDALALTSLFASIFKQVRDTKPREQLPVGWFDISKAGVEQEWKRS